MKITLKLVLVLWALAVGGPARVVDVASELRSLIDSERAFSQASAAKGTRAAFLLYLAEDAILFRPGPVPGKQWLREQSGPAGLLTWQPAFARVSRSGDLGYTSGPWEFRKSGPDEPAPSFGRYLSLWGKQADETWKVVLDIGVTTPPPAAPIADWQPPVDDQKVPGQGRPAENPEVARAILLSVDRDLSKALRAGGSVETALLHIADDAVLLRAHTHPVAGRRAVRAALAEERGRLVWQPIRAAVSRAGDLGYTYGSFQGQESNSPDRPIPGGYYVRVWRRESRGRWKVIVEVAPPNPPAPTRSPQ